MREAPWCEAARGSSLGEAVVGHHIPEAQEYMMAPCCRYGRETLDYVVSPRSANFVAPSRGVPEHLSVVSRIDETEVSRVSIVIVTSTVSSGMACVLSSSPCAGS